MAETPREELAELVRRFATHVAWQRELGATELPHAGTLPTPAAPVADLALATPVPGPPAVTREAKAETEAEIEAVPVAPDAPGTPGAPVGPAPGGEKRAERGRPPQAPALLDLAPANGPAVEGEARLAALRVIQDAVRECTRCGLATTRRNTVFARGDAFARLCFIGEGPGEQEDLQGLPFVGPAGQLLDRIIVGMGLRPDETYVCNIVKCRPPHNRVPAADEMVACTPFLVQQIDLVRPAVIVALGRTAASFLLESKLPMGKLRGKWHAYRGIPVMPTWHPSYVLRDNDRPGSSARREVWEDMKLVLERLALPLPRRG